MKMLRNSSLLFVLSYLCCKGTLSQRNNIVQPMAVNGTDDSYVHMNATDDNTTCKLVPQASTTRDEIASLINTGYKLVKLEVKIDGTNITSRNIYSTSVYHPREWVIATNATGKSMLMLREYFEPMSLYTLGYGVANLNIFLEQYPTNCLDKIDISQIETVLRDSILSNFGSDASLPEIAEVCNQQVKTKGAEMANLVYVCCKNDLSLDGAMTCLENTETIWIKMMFVSLFLIQVFAVAFCPLIIPDTLFKARTVFKKYIFTEIDKSLVLNVKLVDSATPINKRFVKTRRHASTHMSGLRKHLDQLTPGKVYTMHVDGVDLSVRGSKLIAEGQAPFGLMHFIYQFFIRCALRQEIPSVSACCNTKMFRLLSPRIKIRWYQCLRIFTLLLSAVFCASPWILRIWFYYAYEQDAIQYKEKLFETLNLSMPFNGFVVSYLSPIHPLFTAMYIILGLEIVFYLPLSGTVKQRSKFTIRKCFRDMRKSNKMDACGYFMSKMLYPLTRFGIFGCLVAPLCVAIAPFLVLFLALDALPIANLTLRLISNLVYYTLRLISPQTVKFVSKEENDKCGRWINNRLASILVTDFQEQNTRINQFVHASSLIMTLVSIWCVLIMTVDCISFYAECFVYSLIGFILNPRDTMKYVSIILLLVVYGIECFNGVNRSYVAYGKAINSMVQTMVDERMKEIASKTAKDQVNTAFRIEGNTDMEPMYLVAGSERYLKWQAPRLVLFLDSSDIPFIPKSFLMQTGKLLHPICPGQVHILYLKALLDFSLIVLFLFFVFIVIFAFGQAQDISSGGQALAALGSGFLPLIRRKFLSQSHAGTSIDTSNMRWQYMFRNAVKDYKDRWNFEDIHIKEIKPQECSASIADRNETIEGDDENVTSASALLPKDQIPKVDLIVKSVQLANGDYDIELYVPRTRAAECEDGEILDEEDNLQETIV